MGGAREDVIEKKPAAKPERAGVVERGVRPAAYDGYQRIRFHESGGEVHFHDDDRGLKCAIPVSRWHNLFQQLEAGQSVSFVDRKHGTVLEAKVAASGAAAFDVELSLTEQAVTPVSGGVFERLAKFTNS